MSVTYESKITYVCDDPSCPTRTTVAVDDDDVHQLLGDDELVIVENLPVGWAALTVNVIGRCGIRTVTACSGSCLVAILRHDQPNGIIRDISANSRGHL